MDTLIETPYLLEFAKEREVKHEHCLCGAPSATTAMCPNCKVPLMTMLSLDAKDSRLGLEEQGIDRLDLMYCWPCGIAQHDFFYLVGLEGLSLIQTGEGEPETDFPYENYPRWFEVATVDLHEMERSLRENIELYARQALESPDLLDEWDMDDKFRVATPRHQVGGIPYLYSYEPLVCPECKDAMKFLATIADANTDPRGFTGNDCVQVVYFYCEACQMVGARHEVD